MSGTSELMARDSQPSPQQLDSTQKMILVEHFLGLPGVSTYREEITRLLKWPKTTQVSLRSVALVDPVIQQRFQGFVAEETAISGSSPRHLMCPIGSLRSPLHVRCHCPPLHLVGTARWKGQLYCGDPGSPSVALLERKGLIGHGEVFVTEASFRCESTYQSKNATKRARLPEDYGLDLRQVHKSFADWLWDVSEAPVVLLVGRSNEKRLLQRFPRAVQVQLPGPGVPPSHAYLLSEDKKNMSRVVICSQHPEHTVRFSSYSQACQQDYLLNLAAALSGISCPIYTTWCTMSRESILQKQCTEESHAALVGTLMRLISASVRGGFVISPEFYPPTIRKLLGYSKTSRRPKRPALEELECLLQRLCPTATNPQKGKCAYIFCKSRAGRSLKGYCSRHWKMEHPGQQKPRRSCKTSGCPHAPSSGFSGYCRTHYYSVTGGPRKYTSKVPDCQKYRVHSSGYCIPHSKAILGFNPLPRCQYDGCENLRVKQGYCTRHFGIATGKKRQLCCFTGCEKTGYYDRLCTAHYRTVTGKPPPRKICRYPACVTPRVGGRDGYCVSHSRILNKSRYPTVPHAVCKYEGCQMRSPGGYEGYCVHHYRHVKEAGLPPNARCKWDGCMKHRVSGGLCSSHYREVNGVQIARKVTGCKYEGCQKRAQGGSEGYCWNHYRSVKGVLPPHARCKRDGCMLRRKSDGLCLSHYRETEGVLTSRKRKR